MKIGRELAARGLIDTLMIQNADQMYRGEEAQVAQTIANRANGLVPPSAGKGAAPEPSAAQETSPRLRLRLAVGC